MKKALMGGVTLLALIPVSLAFKHEFDLNRAVRESNAFISAFPRVQKTIDPTLFENYTGTYQLEPRFSIEITTDGKNLYAQGTNQIRVKLYPGDEQTFFNDYTEALLTFSDEQPAESMTLRQLNRLRQGNRIK